jgi:hypothetical protein
MSGPEPDVQAVLRLWSDWNRIVDGDIRIDGLVVRAGPEVAALLGRRVLLVDGDEVVEAVVVRHSDGLLWAEPDWVTQRGANATAGELWPADHPEVW